MGAHKRNRSNAFVALGLLLQIAGGALMRWDAGFPLVGWALVVASVPLFVAGCMCYATAKGQSQWYGLAGLFGILGLLVLVVLPDRTVDSVGRWALLKLLALMVMAIGFCAVAVGLWLDQPLSVSDRTDPLPAVCMIGGACLVVGSVVVIVRDIRS